MEEEMTDPSRYDLDVGEDIEHVRSTSSSVEMFEWFQRFWGIAVLAHIIGNPRVGQVVPDLSALGVFTLTTGIVAIIAVLQPYDRRILIVLSALVPVMVFFEAPVLSNHWMLMGMISLALLAAVLSSDSWNWFSTTARGMHLVFYGFAAFAKLNSGFFDPSVSCSVVFANQSLSAAGLPVVDSGSFVAASLPYLTAGIELVIPVLLLRRNTRMLGVVVALGFHGLLSFDLDQHIYDFTGALIPLFLLWLPDSITARLGRPIPRRLQLMLGATLAVFLAGSIAPPGQFNYVLLTDAFFVLWIPAMIALVAWVGSMWRQGTDRIFRPTSPLAWALVALVFFNGLTPYLELKTANAWNMYSNLAVVDGESNHWVVRTGVPLSAGHRDPVEILATDDSGLASYIGSGYVLPRRNFLDYLADHPGVEVEYRQNGLVRNAIGAEIGVEQPILLEKFAPLRAVDAQDPVRCKQVWRPAR
jgi:hypothetical protein